MKSISEIFKAYKKTLDDTFEEHTSNWQNVREEIEKFYRDFLKNLVINYGEIFEDEIKKYILKEEIENLFGSNKINFVAIDGSSFKKVFSEFLVFYGGAYAVRGYLKIDSDKHYIHYKKWDIKEDNSIVAYIPVTFSNLNFSSELAMFLSPDKEKIERLDIHNQLMQLAEIYLAYTFAKDPKHEIDVILMDHSLSSIYISNDILYKIDDLNIIGYKAGNNQLSKSDIYIAYAMPVNEELDIPYCKNFRGEFYIIRQLYNKKFFVNDCFYIKRNKHIKKLIDLGIITERSTEKFIEAKVDIKSRWETIKNIFEYICKEIFIEKNIKALKVKKEDQIVWLTSDDIRFLISIGLRMLIEKCWENNILLVGIVKDTSSRYFSKNYLGVMYKIGVYKFKPPKISIPDRLIFETIPFIDPKIKAPWTSIEFDSVFMSLHLVEDEDGNTYIEGFRGEVTVPHERLFLRSFAQFYVNRSKRNPKTSNVIFIDRLAHPEYDSFNRLSLKKHTVVITKRGDKIDPIFYENNNVINKIQEILIYILSLLTENKYPNVIGYPDPLHKADWGAKEMSKKIKELIKSSELKFITDPLKKSFRDKREEGYKGQSYGDI